MKRDRRLRLAQEGAKRDWISPLWGMIQAFSRGGHQIAVPADCGRSDAEIRALLARRGVESWGYMIVQDALVFSVPARQVGRAESILEAAGMPVGQRLPEPAGHRITRRLTAERVPQARGTSRLWDLLDRKEER